MNINHINLSAYPVNEPESSEYRSLVAEWSTRLADTGLIVYKRLPDAFHSVHGAQSYFEKMPGEFPTDALGSNTHCLGHHNHSQVTLKFFYTKIQLTHW